MVLACWLLIDSDHRETGQNYRKNQKEFVMVVVVRMRIVILPCDLGLDVIIPMVSASSKCERDLSERGSLLRVFRDFLAQISGISEAARRNNHLRVQD